MGVAFPVRSRETDNNLSSGLTKYSARRKRIRVVLGQDLCSRSKSTLSGLFVFLDKSGLPPASLARMSPKQGE